ncbi:hypothetical protein [Thalassospira alkalitolerans]|uniref:hypothetical protein n=1 Tax=Thalassospira alkalitolerans TaxID=1293890 RepID=UPI003AA7EC74
MAFQIRQGLANRGREAIIENTATMIFFRTQGHEESLLPFNFNEEQKLFVQGRLFSKKNDRRVPIIKRDEASGLRKAPF